MACMLFQDRRFIFGHVTHIIMAKVRANDTNFYVYFLFVFDVFCAGFANVDQLFNWL